MAAQEVIKQVNSTLGNVQEQLRAATAELARKQISEQQLVHQLEGTQRQLGLMQEHFAQATPFNRIPFDFTCKQREALYRKENDRLINLLKKCLTKTGPKDRDSLQEKVLKNRRGLAQLKRKKRERVRTSKTGHVGKEYMIFFKHIKTIRVQIERVVSGPDEVELFFRGWNRTPRQVRTRKNLKKKNRFYLWLSIDDFLFTQHVFYPIKLFTKFFVNVNSIGRILAPIC